MKRSVTKRSTVVRKNSAGFLYRTHRKMILNKVWSFHQTTGLSCEDLTSYAHSLFMNAAQSWDPAQSRFSTWLWTVLDNGLTDYYRKEHREPDAFLVEQLSRREINPSARCEFKDELNTLSKEARYVTRLVLNAPEEVFGDVTRPPKIMRGILKDYLHDMDWPMTRVWSVFNEIKALLH